MQIVDAVLNGVVFIALVIGLAIGWRRSPVVRATLVELFLPVTRTGSAKIVTREVLEEEEVRVEMTWKIYVATKATPPPASKVTLDTQTLTTLRAMRA